LPSPAGSDWVGSGEVGSDSVGSGKRAEDGREDEGLPKTMTERARAHHCNWGKTPITYC